ncbi:MAG: filamentous hemagglutinin N-terminal domain-containing protein [Synechococcales bacterium]|nr:filamentous hemagglutinin N-terminal domain-containing protein [Synechococcales bacterium]
MGWWRNLGQVRWLGSLAGIGAVTIAPVISVGQVVSDRSLPTPSIVQQTGNGTVITGGTPQGSHLFHSFEQFSIPTGESVLFDSAPAVQTIFARVTGPSASQIDGTLGSNTSLFLLNPNGILFGPNARLAISGSFLATTANSLRFADGSEFSAVAPQASPLLTVSVPIGLQFGKQPQAIQQQSQLLLGAPGHTLAMVGGDLHLSKSALIGLGGQMSLGSVAGEGVVMFQPSDRGFTFHYPDPLPLGQIRLSEGATVSNLGLNLVGIPAGNIEIQGRSLHLSEGTRILISNEVNQPSGSLKIHTRDRIDVVGRGNYETRLQGLFSEALKVDQLGDGILIVNQAPSISGDLNLTTQQLQMGNGAFIGMVVSKLGQAGAVNLNISDRLDLSASFLGSLAISDSTNSAGKLTINTGEFYAEANSLISTLSLGMGAGGDLTINARNISLIGGTPQFIFYRRQRLLLNTGIGTASEAQGGNLTINTGRLVLAQGSALSVESNGIAANLTINATELKMHQGYIGAGVVIEDINATGSGGNIFFNINGNIELENSTISASINSLFNESGDRSGNGGKITIKGKSLSMNSSAIKTNSEELNGYSGDIKITTDEFIRINGSSGKEFGIFAENNGEGNSGDITLMSETFTLSNYAKITTIINNGVKGGDVKINSRAVDVNSRGRIITMSKRAGKSGNIEINATERATIQGTGIENTTINFLTQSALAGNIDYDAGNLAQNREPAIIFTHPQQGIRILKPTQIIGLSTGETGLFASSYAPGGGGDLFLTAPQIDISGRSILSVSSWTTGDSGAMYLNADKLRVQDSLLLTTTMTGRGGIIAVTANQAHLNNAQIIAATTQGTGAKIDFQVRDRLILRSRSQITARAFEQGIGGEIKLNTGLLLTVPRENNDIIANALAGKGGTILINSQGIFGIEPRSLLTHFSDISASAEWAGGVDGQVEINQLSPLPEQVVRELPANFIQPATQVAQVCSPKMRRNSLVITGRGGLPPSPGEMVNLLLTELNDRNSPSSIAAIESPRTEQVIEATSWQRQPDGTVKLVNQERDPRPMTSVSNSRHCAL